MGQVKMGKKSLVSCGPTADILAIQSDSMYEAFLHHEDKYSEM